MKKQDKYNDIWTEPGPPSPIGSIFLTGGKKYRVGNMMRELIEIGTNKRYVIGEGELLEIKAPTEVHEPVEKYKKPTEEEIDEFLKELRADRARAEETYRHVCVKCGKISVNKQQIQQHCGKPMKTSVVIPRGKRGNYKKK